MVKKGSKKETNMKIRLSNDAGIVKESKVGISWTVFFFGFFVPFIRGDMKWGIILLLGALVLGVPTAGLGSAALFIVFAFLYNKIYINDLLKKGFKPATELDSNILKEKFQS